MTQSNVIHLNDHCIFITNIEIKPSKVAKWTVKNGRNDTSKDFAEWITDKGKLQTADTMWDLHRHSDFLKLLQVDESLEYSEMNNYERLRSVDANKLAEMMFKYVEQQLKKLTYN